MKIGSRVYVSLLSRSKIAGEAGTLIGSSARDGYKVRTDFGVIGYAQVRHVSEIFGSDAPLTPVKVGGHVVDTDVAHAYLNRISPLPLKTYPAEIEARLPDPTDLLTLPVRFDSPFHRPTLGWVSDQWIEDGVELLNVVHDGDFTIVPRSFITNVYTVLYKDGSFIGVI